MVNKETEKLGLYFGDFGHPIYRCRDLAGTPVDIERLLSFADEMKMCQ